MSSVMQVPFVAIWLPDYTYVPLSISIFVLSLWWISINRANFVLYHHPFMTRGSRECTKGEEHGVAKDHGTWAQGWGGGVTLVLCRAISVPKGGSGFHHGPPFRALFGPK